MKVFRVKKIRLLDKSIAYYVQVSEDGEATSYKETDGSVIKFAYESAAGMYAEQLERNGR